MSIFSKLDKSAAMMNGMAERLGADIGEAVLRDPEIETAKYRTMVLRCSKCTDQDACAELQGSCAHLDNAPDYCRNKDAIEHLRDE